MTTNKTKRFFPNHVEGFANGITNVVPDNDDYTAGVDKRQFNIGEADDYGMPTGRKLCLDKY